MTRVFPYLFLLISLSVKAEDILLDISTPIKSNKKIIVATYLRNQPDYYYFSVVYMFRGSRLIKYKTKLSFTLDDASLTHAALETWITKVWGNKVIVVDPIEICPIDKSLLPFFIKDTEEDNQLRFECSSQ